MNEIGIFICLFNRINRIPLILNQLNKQTFKNFDLYFLNNNCFEKEKIEKSINEHKDTLNVYIKNYEFNTGPMIRFVEAGKSEYQHVIFLDDDEEFSAETVEVLYKERAEKTLSARVAANFKDNFHIRTRVKPGEQAKYLGPGGMIVDASIFRKEEFWKNWSPEFYVCDDCWLSYFAEKENWNKKASNVVIGLNHSESTAMLKNSVIRDLKQKFVEKYNWR